MFNCRELLKLHGDSAMGKECRMKSLQISAKAKSFQEIIVLTLSLIMIGWVSIEVQADTSHRDCAVRSRFEVDREDRRTGFRWCREVRSADVSTEGFEIAGEDNVRTERRHSGESLPQPDRLPEGYEFALRQIYEPFELQLLSIPEPGRSIFRVQLTFADGQVLYSEISPRLSRCTDSPTLEEMFFQVDDGAPGTIYERRECWNDLDSMMATFIQNYGIHRVGIQRTYMQQTSNQLEISDYTIVYSEELLRRSGLGPAPMFAAQVAPMPRTPEQIRSGGGIEVEASATTQCRSPSGDFKMVEGYNCGVGYFRVGGFGTLVFSL